ncbi:hypothetical protein Syun_004768 [Stephania yunnanensis]|uniref:Thioredoxin-dependent peroxiredoxin Q n=1 Tax=Stephania yunnanensis TaxID=152371 RepID=A0AAP0L3V6_9MAGN
MSTSLINIYIINDSSIFTDSFTACAFRDSYKKFKKAEPEVIGISGDDSHLTRNRTIGTTTAFAKKYGLPFTLLSDEGNKIRKEWGVPSDLFGALPEIGTQWLHSRVEVDGYEEYSEVEYSPAGCTGEYTVIE